MYNLNEDFLSLFQFILAFMKKILLMDDDMVIRLAMAKLIEGLGYVVDTFESGEIAIVKYKEKFELNDPYDVVILDYTVKNGMNGIETMEEILKINSEAIGILASGRIQSDEIEDYEKFGFKEIIAKPFTIHDLAKILEDLLPV